MSKPRIKRPTDDEDAAINAGIAADADTLEGDDAFFARAKPAEKRYRGQRGPQKSPTKVAVTMRMSGDVVDAFREHSDKYGPAMEQVLRAHAEREGWL